MKLGDAVVATVQGREVTGVALYFTENDRVQIRLDEPQVFASGPGTGFQQTVPKGKPIRVLYWPRDQVRVDPSRPNRARVVPTKKAEEG